MIRIYHRVKEPNKDINLSGPCLPGVHKVFLNSDKEYQICERSAQSLKIGSIESGIDFSKCEKILTDYYNFVKKSCKDCWASRLCGLCEVSPIRDNEYDQDRFFKQCKMMKKHLDDSLIIYARVVEQNARGFDFLEE